MTCAARMMEWTRSTDSAGAWVRKKLPALLHRPPAEVELIARACDWHVCPDHKAEWDHPTLWLLKDADGLDRARLHDLDPSFLRHAETLRLGGRGEEAVPGDRRPECPEEDLGDRRPPGVAD